MDPTLAVAGLLVGVLLGNVAWIVLRGRFSASSGTVNARPEPPPEPPPSVASAEPAPARAREGDR